MSCNKTILSICNKYEDYVQRAKQNDKNKSNTV
jgi:hypothetical protein